MVTVVRETDRTSEEQPVAGVKTLLPPRHVTLRESLPLCQLLVPHDGSQLSLRPPEETLRDSGDNGMWQVHVHCLLIVSSMLPSFPFGDEVEIMAGLILGDLSVTNLFPVLKRLMGSLVGMAQYSSRPRWGWGGWACQA